MRAYKLSTHVREDVNIIEKIQKFCVYRMQSFQTNLTALSKILEHNSRNNIMQLKYEYIEFIMIYEHLHELSFKCICSKHSKFFIS